MFGKKTYTQETLTQLIDDGFCEVVCEPTTTGFCELLWLASNMRTVAYIIG